MVEIGNDDLDRTPGFAIQPVSERVQAFLVARRQD